MSPIGNSPTPLDPIEEAIFNAASELVDPQARAAFLDRACGADSALRARLDALLRADDDAREFFAGNPLNLEKRPGLKVDDEPAATMAEGLGVKVGRYKLLQKIGEGGMGVVYMAEQEQPVRRRVALKIIKLGMDTRAVIARFEAERQALALMDHPNIARILDGGETETGRPYFVMELVQGVPLIEYCDKTQSSVSARIQLFVQVCEAVQSAHQKGIIHRDLKPSNVMVTLHDGIPVPKVIDFGVAKAANQRLTEKTLFTNYGTMIGTPAYMSPEQAEMSGLDVDTRSDIYSLGVLLYELLTGAPPFSEQRLRSVGYGEMQRIITQEEPERPSTRLTKTRTLSAAARRDSKSQIGTRQSEIDPDLDWIVMKCLEKDRARRYETANGIAADIHRYLENEPVMARPPSTVYKLQKFVRRNKAFVTAAASILVGLVAVIIFGTVSYRREQAARSAADESRASEVSQKQRAQNEATRADAEALRARQFQYASDMNLARLAAEEGNLFRALQLLNRHRPEAPVISSQLSATSYKPPLIADHRSLITDLRGWEWRYLINQCQSEEIATLGSHSNDVITVAFAPDGNMAVTGGNDGFLRIWDVKARKEAGVLAHAAPVIGSQFSPDGRWLAVLTDRALIVREWPSKATKIEITNWWFRVNTMTFSPDSKRLAFARFSEGIAILDLETRQEIAHFPAETGWITPLGLAFSPDGETLAFSDSESGEIILSDVSTQTQTRRWKAHSWYITRIFFSADGQQLYSCSGDRSIRIWDAKSARELNKFEYPLGFGPSRVSSPRLSTDGKLLATATAGGGVVITIQEMPSGRELRRLRGNKDMVSDAAFSPDGRFLISGSYDGSVRLWDLTTNRFNADVREFPADYQRPKAPDNAFSLSPDGRHFACIYTNGTFSLREIPSLVEGPRLPVPIPDVSALAVAVGGQTIAFVGGGGDVVLWNALTGKTNLVGQPFASRCSRATFSLDGKHLAIGSTHAIAVCDVMTKKFRTFQNTKPSALLSLSFSPNALKLMAGYWNGAVKVWDFDRLSPERALPGHGYQVNSMALLPDEKTLVSVSRQIVFWDLETGAQRRVLQPRPALFRTVAISPDGSRLAAGAADGLITIWDMATMQEVASLSGHTRPLMDMRFLPDGNTLVSVADNEVRVWRAASLQEADARRDSR